MERARAIETYERLRYHFIDTYIKFDKYGIKHGVGMAQSKFDIVVNAFLKVFGTLPTLEEQKENRKRMFNQQNSIL